AAPATDHDEGSPRVVISGLNRTAFDLAVYASQGWSPTHHARLASGCWSGSTGRDWLPAGFHLKGFKLPTIPLSRAFLARGQTEFQVNLKLGLTQGAGGVPTEEPLFGTPLLFRTPRFDSIASSRPDRARERRVRPRRRIRSRSEAADGREQIP